MFGNSCSITPVLPHLSPLWVKQKLKLLTLLVFNSSLINITFISIILHYKTGTHTHMLQTEVQTLPFFFFFQTLPFCLNQYLEIFKSYCDYVIDVYNRHISFISLCNLLIFPSSRLLGCMQVPNSIDINPKFV